MFYRKDKERIRKVRNVMEKRSKLIRFKNKNKEKRKIKMEGLRIDGDHVTV